MSNQTTNHNVEKSNSTEKKYTQAEVDNILSETIRRFRETELRDAVGRDIPEEILKELYSSDLEEFTKKFKRSIPKYNNGEWIPVVSEYSDDEEDEEEPTEKLCGITVGADDLINAINCLTETTRVQACAATKLYEQLKENLDRGLQEKDMLFHRDAVEKARQLSVFGFSSAKLQENEAKRLKAKAFNLPHYVNRLYIEPASGKKNAFDEEFMMKYWEAKYKEELLESIVRNNQASNDDYRGRSRSSRKGRGRGGNYSNHQGQYDNNYYNYNEY